MIEHHERYIVNMKYLQKFPSQSNTAGGYDARIMNVQICMLCKYITKCEDMKLYSFIFTLSKLCSKIDSCEIYMNHLVYYPGYVLLSTTYSLILIMLLKFYK